MAHYRKIVVDNRTFEYRIGKSCIKIKGIDVFYRPEDDDAPVTPKNIESIIRQHIDKNG